MFDALLCSVDAYPIICKLVITCLPFNIIIDFDSQTVFCFDTNLQLDEDQIKSYAFAEIENLVLSHGKDLKEHYPTMPRIDVSMNNDGRNRLIYDDLRYNKDLLKEEHERLMATMTMEQRIICNTIMAQIEANRPGLFFFIWVWWNIENFHLESNVICIEI